MARVTSPTEVCGLELGELAVLENDAWQRMKMAQLRQCRFFRGPGSCRRQSRASYKSTAST